MHECDKPPSEKQLNKYFGISIRKNRIEHYKKVYKQHCLSRKNALKHLSEDDESNTFDSSESELSYDRFFRFLMHHSETLTEKLLTSRHLLLNSILDATEPYRSNVDRIITMKQVLWIINSVSVLASYMVPWDVYLVFFKSGRDIIRNVFTGSNRILAILYLYVVLNCMKETTYSFELLGQMLNYIPMVLTREDMLKIGISKYFNIDESGRSYISQEVIDRIEISILFSIILKTIEFLEKILTKYELIEKAKMMLNSIDYE